MRIRWLMFSTLMAVVGLAASGCAGQGGSNAALESALAQLQADGAYPATRRCLPSERFDAVTVLDDQHLLFRSTGGEAWINALRTRCTGLQRGHELEFRGNGMRICNLDAADAVNRFMLWWRSGPVCTLGKFHRLSEDQAQLIRDAG